MLTRLVPATAALRRDGKDLDRLEGIGEYKPGGEGKYEQNKLGGASIYPENENIRSKV